jgi:hypothetical protein
MAKKFSSKDIVIIPNISFEGFVLHLSKFTRIGAQAFEDTQGLSLEGSTIQVLGWTGFGKTSL